MKWHFILLFSGLFFCLPICGQTIQQVSEKLHTSIQPIIGLQIWSYYSHGQSIYNQEEEVYEPVSNRFGTSLRRSRLGFKAQPYDYLLIKMVGAMDLVGRDVLDATVGGSNNGSSPTFRLWDAYIQWKISKENSYLNLTGGYFVPQVGRESLTSAFVVNSLEKAWTQNYIRRHLVGIGPGRAAGMNLGGLWLSKEKKLGFNYNVGLFNPLFQAYQRNSMGKHASPLATARAVFYLGDPEMMTYTLGGSVNQLSKRTGISLGIGGAYQGQTDLYVNNSALGIDLAVNWKHLNLDGEWMWMQRSGEREKDNNQMRHFSYLSQAGHIRLSYNLLLLKKVLLEPTFMLSRFQGGLELHQQQDALAVGESSGIDQSYDVGVNWYVNQQKLKIGFHYTWRHGEPGELPAGLNTNLYYFQSGAGAIRRGNWLGLGLIIRL